MATKFPGSYQYVKKTGYLVKSPATRKVGRWRKRWCMLVDQMRPALVTGMPERCIRLEYYAKHEGLDDHELSKLKGIRI